MNRILVICRITVPRRSDRLRGREAHACDGRTHAATWNLARRCFLSMLRSAQTPERVSRGAYRERESGKREIMMLTMSADNYTRLKQGVSMSSWRTTTPRSRGMSKNSKFPSESVSMEVRGQTCCRENRVCIERSAPLTSHQLYLLPRWVSLDSSLLRMQFIRYPLLVISLFRMLSLFHRNSAPLPPPTRTHRCALCTLTNLHTDTH